nr:putative ribonuclease H-like domain-containing protein [Tanacetum cinerariifolium]
MTDGYVNHEGYKSVITATEREILLGSAGLLRTKEGCYDWSYQAEDEPANFALMAITSLSSSSDNQLSPKPAEDLSHTNRPSAPIIEDWVSDSEDESETNDPQIVPSFVQSSKQVTTPRTSVQPAEAPILDATPKPTSPKYNSSSKIRNRKTYFVCKSVDHLIKDCDYHVHTQSKPVSIIAVRPVSAALPKIMVTRPRHAHSIDTKFKSPIRRHITHRKSPKTSSSPPRVTAAQVLVQKAKEDPYVQRYQVMKKRLQTEAQARRNMIMYLKNVVGFRLDYFKGMSYDNIPKRRKLNEEVEDLKQHLEIVPDEDDDVYTEATLLARKVPVVDYQIIQLNNKPRYKIIRDDGTHQLYVSFITLLKNFDREDLESLWSIVKERFSTLKPNNFFDDYLLTTLRAMFKRPDGQDQVWKSQRSSGPTWLFDIDSLIRTMNYQPVTAGNQSNPSVGFQDKFDAEKARKEVTQQYMLFPVWSSSSSNPQNKDGDAAFDGIEHEVDTKKPESAVNVSPSSSAQSGKQDDKTKKKAKGKSSRLTSIIGNFYKSQSYSNNKNSQRSSCITKHWAIGTKWVYRNKKDERGIVVTNKARRVAQGHTQEERIDYEEVFAPVARIEAIRLFLAYASFMGFMVYQMDVKNAFLYGTIEEDVYVCQPLGFEDPDHPDKVYKVRKDILLVQIYVDDIIFGAINKYLCKSFKKLMKDKFQMSSMGELTFFLGLQVKQKKDGIFIIQDKYVAEILNKTEGKLASTPIDTEKPLLKDPDGEDVDVHIYRSMIGSLMYLTSSRPDIIFTVCACARFQVTPKALHLHAVKRIFRYLKGKLHLGLWYPKDSPFDLVAYSDSDYVGSNDVTRLQALVDKKKVVIIEVVIRDVLRLDDADGVDCLPNEEIFAELAHMGYEKPSTKLTFYKDFFSSQWKFLNHTILQSMSAKRTSWNEFSSAMASAVICLSTGEIEEQGDAEEQVQDNVDDAAQGADTTILGDDVQDQSIPSPTPPSPPPQQPQDLSSTSVSLEKSTRMSSVIKYQDPTSQSQYSICNRLNGSNGLGY